MTSAYRFLPWTRRGLAASIAGPDTDGALPARAALTVALDLSDGTSASGLVELHGPGDVTGLDPRVILRSDPRPGAVAVEPNYLAVVEFDPPDLPWLFTPAAPAGAGPAAAVVRARRRAGARRDHHRLRRRRVAARAGGHRPGRCQSRAARPRGVVGVGTRADRVRRRWSARHRGRPAHPAGRQPEPTGLPPTARARHHVPRLRRPGVRARRATRPRPAR